MDYHTTSPKHKNRYRHMIKLYNRSQANWYLRCFTQKRKFYLTYPYQSVGKIENDQLHAHLMLTAYVMFKSDMGELL